jgi:hypothetical protein
MSERIAVTVRTGSGKSYEPVAFFLDLDAAQVQANIDVLEVAKRELAEREDAKPIPPGTRIRYKSFSSAYGPFRWHYGTVSVRTHYSCPANGVSAYFDHHGMHSWIGRDAVEVVG